MNKLIIKMIRDMLQSKGQFIAIILVIAVGIIFFTGFSATHSSLDNMKTAFYKDQNLADLWVYYRGIDDNGVSKINSIKGVNRAEGVLKLDGKLSNNEAEFFVQSIPDSNSINKPSIIKGALPKGKTECIIDKGYADANNSKIGDRIKVTVNEKSASLKITGVYISPEYIYLVKNVEDILPDHKKFGVLMANNELMTDIAGRKAYNEVIIDSKDNTDLNVLQKSIESETSVYGYGYSIDRGHELSYAMLKSDIDQLKSMGLIFPNMFFLVAAIIIFISMSRNVELQRGQIAIMKAVGKSNFSILMHYLSFSIISGIIGSIVGSLLGVLLLPQAMYSSYKMAYTLPAINPSGYAASVIEAAVLALLFGIIATLFSCYEAMKEVPAQAMRPKPPKKIKKILFERNEKLWAWFSYNKKLILRNIFANKKRAILSSVGIIGSVGLIIASLAFNDVIKLLLKEQYQEIFKYDISITLNMPVMHEDRLNFNDTNVSGIYMQSNIPVSYTRNKKNTTSNLYALDKNNKAISLFDSKGNEIKLSDDGIIISKKFADTNHIKLGDTINVKLIPYMQASSIIKAQVRGIADMYLSQDMYTSFDYLSSRKVIAPVNTVYLTVKNPDKVNSTISYLKSDSRVKVASSKSEIADKVNSSMQVMNTFIAIMILASAILALTVVFNISSINIFERRRDIATLKVLGYYRKEVNSLVFTENLMITGFGSIFGIGFGILLFYGLTHTAIPDSMMVPTIIKPLSVIISIALGFAFTVIANQMLRRKIKKIDMVESLKSVE